MITAEKAHKLAIETQQKPVKKNISDAIRDAAKQGLFTVDVIIPHGTSLRTVYKDLINLRYSVSITDKNALRIGWKNYLLR